MVQPPPLFYLFSVISIKHYTILQQIISEKCPYSILHWDLNSQPSDYESPPLTTRPELPPYLNSLFELKSFRAFV